MDMNDSWMAGLFEGEGYCTTTTPKSRTHPYVRIGLNMTDRDVVERFRNVAGCGNIHVQSRKPSRKTMYCWHAGKQSEVKRLILRLLPHMGQRRKKKLWEALEVVETNIEKMRRDLPTGVYQSKKRFRAVARIDGQEVHVGTFDTPAEASKAREEALRMGDDYLAEKAQRQYPLPIGVVRKRNKYRGEIRRGGKRMRTKHYETPEQAAVAREEKIKELNLESS